MRRDELAMRPEGYPGLELDPDHADILHPGPAWRAEVEERRLQAERLKARLLLGQVFGTLPHEERAALLREVLSG